MYELKLPLTIRTKLLRMVTAMFALLTSTYDTYKYVIYIKVFRDNLGYLVGVTSGWLRIAQDKKLKHDHNWLSLVSPHGQITPMKMAC